MGRRYTPEEIQEMQALIGEGFTNREIATRLDRTPAGIRNIRHRTNLKAETAKTLQSLLQKERELNTQIPRLQKELVALSTRRDHVKRVLRVEEQALKQRIQTALIRLKDEKPELFHITFEEQVWKLVGELSGAFINWLIT